MAQIIDKFTYEDFCKNMLKPFSDNERDDKTYFDYLYRLFVDYQEYVKSINEKGLKDKISDIDNIFGYIINVIEDYNRGNIQGAFIEASFLSSYKLQLYATSSDEKFWYRARLLEDGKSSFTPKEMFHLPFQLRHKLNNTRFSITGYPCLYLGSSILACWEELKRPSLDKLCVSCFKMNKELKILDLTIPGKDDEIWTDEKKRLKFLVTWPLIMACSVKTKYSDEPFKEEYIFPQLLIQSILQDAEFDGVAYTSTQKDDFFADDIKLHTNLAIPVKGVNDEGYCDVLKECFEVTKGMSLIEAQIKNKIGPQALFSGNDVDGQYGDNITGYGKTIFGQMEKMLIDNFNELKSVF